MKSVIDTTGLRNWTERILNAWPELRVLVQGPKFAPVRVTREEAHPIAVRRNRANFGAVSSTMLMLALLFSVPAASYATVRVSTGSGTWSSSSTWSPSGTPSSSDDLIIRSGDTITVSSSTTVHSVIFTNTSTSTGTISVNSGITLTVSTSITAQNNASANTAASLAGSGTINCASLTIGGTTVPTGSAAAAITSTIGTLAISGNLAITGQNSGANNNTATFSLASGSASVAGSVAFTAPAGSSATLDMTAGAQTGTLTLTGATPFTGTGTFLATGTGATVSYSGSAAQVLNPVAYRNLTINNANNVSMNGNASVAGTLTFSNGRLVTGVNTLSIGASGSVSGVTSSRYVRGFVQKAFSTGSGLSFTFPIGDANNYTPVALASMTVGTAGNLTASVISSEHPQVATSGLNAAQSVNRYWTLSPDGTLAVSTASATFTFVSGDVDSGASTANFLVRRYNAGWNTTTIGTRTSTTSQATGLNAFGDFAMGENLTDHYAVTAVSPALNVPFVVTATAQDIFNQAVTADSSTVVTMTSTGNAQFDRNGDGNFGDNTITLTNGVAGILARDLTAESVTLTATDPGNITGNTTINIADGVGAFRSIASGAWSNPAIWQTNNGSGWVTASFAPTSANSTAINIQAPYVVTVMSSVTADHVIVQAGAQLTVSNSITMTIAKSTSPDFDVFGTVQNSGTITTTGTLNFEAGSTYQHNYILTAGTIPTANWDANSTCSIIGYTSNTGTPGGLSQTFGNFVWNCPNQTGTIVLETGNVTQTIKGDFTVISTGSGTINAVGSSDSMALTVNGDFNIQGGNFNFSSSGNSGAGPFTLNLMGAYYQTGGTFTHTSSRNDLNIFFAGTSQNFTLSGGTLTSSSMNFTVNSGTTLNLSNNLPVPSGQSCTVNGTLNCGTSAVTGSGSFTLSSGANLILGSINGLSSTTGSGNIQVTGSRSLSTTANYLYNGSAAQSAGNALPSAVNNLTIANPSGVTLSASTTVNGTLVLSNGVLATGSFTVSQPTTGSYSGANAGSYVNGNFLKTFNFGSGQSFTFPIGDAANYEPLGLSSMNVTHSGTITARTTASQHPNLGTSLIDSASDINRYWTINSGSSLAGTFNANFNYSSNDVTDGAVPSAFIAQMYNGSSWANSTLSGTPSVTNASITGQSTFGDFAIGEAKGSQTITFPSIGNQTYGVAPITLAATASSGLPVSYSVTGPATVNSGILTITGAANVTVTASQAGNGSWKAATNVSQTISVAKLGITGSVTINDKVYDGTTNATIATRALSGVVGSDNVALSGGTAGFASKHVGTNKTVNITGLSLINSSATNYTLASSSFSTTADITARALTVTGASTSKGYDGTNTSATAPTISSGTIQTGDTSGFNETYINRNVGTSKTMIPAGAVNDGNGGANYSVTFVNANVGTITTRAITVKAGTDSKVYDGTNSSAVIPSIISGSLVGGDSLAYSQVFNTKNVGTGKTLTPIGAVSDGNNGANYAVTTNTVATGIITVRPITVTAATVAKTFDGNTSSSVLPTITTGSLAGTDAAAFTQSFNTRDVGTNKTVTPAGSASDGNSGNNYSVTLAPANVGTISTATVTGNVTINNKVYDGTTAATIATRSLTGVINPDVVNLSGGVAQFDDKNAANGKNVSVSGLALSGANAGNYTLASTDASSSANITQRTLTISATGTPKMYDGGLTANVTLSDNRISGDDLSATYASASFADKNVGPAKLINVTGIAVTGGDISNYSPNSSTTTTAAITPAGLTPSVTVSDKVYDATTAGTIATRDLAGIIGLDSVSLDGGTAQFADKNVDSNKTVNIANLALGGPDSGNYSLNSSNATTTASINLATVSLGISVSDKVYDGTAAATVTNSVTNGWFSPDDLTVSGDPALFASKNVGAGIQVTMPNLVLSGVDSTNYQLSTNVAVTSASITSLPLDVAGITAAPKIYDGATNAALNTSGATLVGAINGDDVQLDASLASGAFADKNAAVVKTVTVSGLALAGNDSANYSLNPVSVNSYITAALVTANITAADKMYDGTATAAITGRTLSGVLGLDDVSLTGGTAIFSDKNVQNGKAVNATGFSLAGNDAPNYALASDNSSTTASITARPLVISATGTSKIYDATTAAVVTYADDRLTNDVLTVAGTAAFADSGVATNKPVSVTAISLSGPDAVNYAPTATTVSCSADITPALLTVKANDVSRLFSAPNPDLAASYTGFVTGEDTNVLQGAPVLYTTADTNSPEGAYPITIANGTLSAANYSFQFVNGTLTVFPAGLLFTDDFTRDSDPQPLTAPWQVQSGNWTVTGGQLVTGPNDPMSYGTAYIDTNWSDYEVSASIQFSAFNAFAGGIGGRLDATTGSHYAAWLYPESSTVPGGGNMVRLIKFQDWQNWGCQGTNCLPLAQASLPAVGTEKHTVKLAFHGNQIAVYVDGVKMIDTNDIEAQPLTQGGITTEMWTDVTPYTMTLDNVVVAAPQPQTISFAALPDKTYGDPAFDLSATASSGLPVAFSVVSGPASISNSTLTITGAGTVTVQASQAGDAIFGTATNVDQAFLVNPAQLTVAASNSTRAYGVADSTFTGSVAGVVNGDDITVNFVSTATSTSGVGDYDITPAFNDPNQRLTNYVQSISNGVLTITPVSLTVAVADATRAYGAANPPLSGNVTGFVAADGMSIGYITSANPTSPVGHYDILPTLDDPGQRITNYNVSITTGTLSVTPAPLTITAGNANKTYGQTVSFTGTEFGTSGLLNSDSVNSVSLASGGSVVGAAVAGSPYAIVPSAASGSGLGNYTITYANGSLSVAPASLAGTVQNVSRTYGAANPAYSVTYTGFVNNDDASVVGGPIAFSCMRDDMPADTNCPVGHCTIHVTLGQSAANYTIAYTDGLMTVDPASLLVSALNASKPYGATNPVPVAMFAGFMNNEDASVLSGTPAFDVQADASSPVGQYPIVASLGSLSNANYAFNFSNATLNVTAGAITITAKDAAKTYGQPLSFAGTEFTVSGLQGGDSVDSVSLTSDGSAATAGVASYAILPTNAIGTGLSNYTIAYANGSLSVNPAALTITASDANKTYGQTVAFAGTEFGTTGLVNGDSVSSVTLASDGSSATAGVASYAITATDANGTGLTNYTITYSNGSLTINPAALTITAGNANKTYGQTVSFAGTEFSTSGLLNNDSVASVSLASGGSVAGAAVAGSPYAIVPSAASGSGLGNYTITYDNGSLSVAPASLAGTVQNVSRAYGAANPAYSVTYTGFVNNEDASVVSGPISFSCMRDDMPADTNCPVGHCTIHVTLGQSAANYTIAYTDGLMTVDPAPLLVSALNASKPYGATNPVPAAMFAGFMNNEDASVLSGTPAFDVQADASSPVGQYPIVASLGSLSNANYAFNFSNATLNVTAGAITITAKDAAKTYGQPLSFAGTEFTVSGLQGSDSVDSISLTSDGSAAAAGVSSYAILPTNAIGTGLSNYTIAYAIGSLSVNPASLTITASDTNKTYGQTVAFAGTEFGTTGLVNGDSVSSVTLASDGSSATAGVASYAITATDATGTGLTNYTIAYSNGSLTINPAALTITAGNANKTYGQSVSFAGTEFSTSGLLNNDAVTSVSLASGGSVAGAAVAGSPYAIVPSAASGSGLGNYTITYANGSLTVDAATLTLSANDATKVYGQLNPAFSGTITGVLNNDSITLGFGTTAGQFSPIGKYPITPAAVDHGGKLANYSVSITPAQLTITAASSAITWTNPADIYYGQVLGGAELNASVSGAGILTYNPPAGTALTVSNSQVLSVTFAPADTNYLPATATVLINVLPAQTAASVTSSTNPALPGSTVTFTATLEPVLPGSNTFNLAPQCCKPSGLVQFSVDGLPAGDPVPVTAGVASYDTSTLAHGTHTVAVNYLGDTNYTGSTNAMATTQIVNTPPTAQPYTVTMLENSSYKFSASRLLQLANDPDGDSITLSNVVSTDTNGGSAILDGNMITYTPAVGTTNTESFSYTVVDSLGSTATGTVTVQVTPAPTGGSSTPSVTRLSNGHAAVNLTAEAGETYILQGSADLQTWVDLGPVVAGPDGMIRVEDGEASSYPARYYRLVYAE